MFAGMGICTKTSPTSGMDIRYPAARRWLILLRTPTLESYMHGFARRISVLSATGLLIVVSGCGGSSPSGTAATSGVPTTPATTPAMSVYVFQNNDAFAPPQPSSILQFAKSASGSTSPLSSITGPANVIFDTVTEDGGGNLYVGGHTYNASPNTAPGVVNILEYTAGSTGTATPLRSISGSATGLQQLSTNPIFGLDLDAAGNLYVAADVAIGSGPTGRIYAAVSVFPPTANGDVSPAKVIAGSLTTMASGPPQIAVTASGTLYVPNPAIEQADSILIFAPASSGNIAPTATLGGAATTIYTVKGIALDSAGNIYVASLAQSTSNVAESAVPSILVFAAGATGNVAPIRAISCPATTMPTIGNLRVDSAGEVFVLSGTTILKFAAGATGNIAPAAAITSPSYFQPLGSIAAQ